MLTLPDPHHLLVFWVQLAVLLFLARGLGHLVHRLGQPPVIGEILAGVLLGPSILGGLAPGVSRWLFPADSEPLLAVAWFGVVLLLAVTGFEVDLPLVRRLIRRSALVPVGALVVPLLFGFAVGWVLPQVFVGDVGSRTLFAGFVGVALAMSALPVVARILLDMGLIRRDVGQLTMVAAMADDLVGWVLLGMLAGVAAEGVLSVGSVAVTLVWIGVFLAAALTLGQVIVDRALRASLRLTEGIAGAVTVTLVITLVAASISQMVGVEAVFGAFVAGIVVGRSPFRRREVQASVELMSTAVFAPIFFATVGMFLDLAELADPVVLSWSLVILAVACASKLGGAYLGARLGGLDPATGLAIGVGLNARGALGIITATVALGLGVFSDAAYTVIVLMALVTSMMVPPMLRWALERVTVGRDEEIRLEQEHLLRESVVANARRVLLPTRGGIDSRLAARLVDLALSDQATVTVLHLHDGDVAPARVLLDEVAELCGHRRTERRAAPTRDPAADILRQSRQGFDLLAVGATHDVHHPRQFSPVLSTILTSSPIPVLLVRAGRLVGEGLSFRRILTASTGTRVGRAAEEIAYQLGYGSGAEVDVVHVVSRGDQVLHAAWSGDTGTHPTARGLLDRSVELGRRFGAAVSGVTRVGTAPDEQLLDAARERGADTVVIGTRVREVDGQPFLGHGTEFLLQHAPQTLVVVAFPPPVV